MSRSGVTRSAEERITILRDINFLREKGFSIERACETIGIASLTYQRWSKRYAVDSGLVKRFIEENMTELENLNKVPEINSLEYIQSIFDLKPIKDKDVFYVLSRLLLARDNMPEDEDHVDETTVLHYLIIDFAYVVVELHDN